MNLKVFFRIMLILIVVIGLIGGVVAGGVALSYRFFSHGNTENVQDEPDDHEGSSAVKNAKKKEKVLNLLLLGVDAEGYRTDVIILTQYNFNTKKVKMLQIPRDTKIETTRSDKKVNSAYGFGKEEELFKAVNGLVGIEVDKYFLVNLKGFRALVDEIGGVKMNVPINMNYSDPVQGLYINLRKGEQTLDGRKAEMFIRFRKNNDGSGYPEGDLGRIKAQQEFISNVIDKILSFKNIFKAPKLASIILKNIKTNFSTSEIPKYIGEALKLDKENINMMTLPGESDYSNGIWYFLCDQEKTDELIEQHFTPSIVEKDIDELNLESNRQNREQTSGNNLKSEVEQKPYKAGLFNQYIKIEVINGCDDAEAVSIIVDNLKQKNFNVVKTEKLNGVKYSKTKVIDRTNMNHSKEVAKALEVTDIVKDLDKSKGVDVTVIIGEDMVR